MNPGLCEAEVHILACAFSSLPSRVLAGKGDITDRALCKTKVREAGALLWKQSNVCSPIE